MRKTFILTSFIALTLMGCEQTKETLGLKRDRPDEFNVLERRPLNVPPGYGLRPPVPENEKQPQHEPRDEAKSAIHQGQTRQQTDETSAAEESLINNAGHKDPSVRQELAAENSDDSKSIGEKLAFWKDEKEKGTIIDPQEEYIEHYGHEHPSTNLN